jgi:hypothetical protein
MKHHHQSYKSNRQDKILEEYTSCYLGNLPSMSGKGKLEQTSQFSKTMCDCKTTSKNSNQLLEDENISIHPT